MIRAALLLCLPLFAGEHPCAACHRRQVEAYARGPVARSQPDGRLRHAGSDSKIEIRHNANGVTIHHLASRGLTAEYPIAYAIGAGKVRNAGANGDRHAAIVELRHSIELDPSSPDAYRKPSEIYDQLRLYTQSKQALADYLKFMPQNIGMRRN